MINLILLFKAIYLKKINFLVTDYFYLDKNGETIIFFKNYIDRNLSYELVLES